MATETSIPESVCLKKAEMEENALISESFVTELLGNKVKQLEISSQVAETVNTPLETGKPTDESGTFFQALSVPKVIADEQSNTPESCKAVKQTEPEEETIKNEEKAIENEVREEDAPEDVGSKPLDSVAPIKKEALEKNQGDSDGVTSSQDAAYEDVKETITEHVTTVADFKEQDLKETAKEFDKEEPEDKSVDAQEASEQCEIGSKDIEEQKSEESVKKIEQDGLLQAITSDACIPTETKSQVETIEHEEKEQDVNVLEKDQDKDDITSAQEETFEGGLQEKNHNEDNEDEVVKAKESIQDDNDVCVSTETTPVKESIKNDEPDDEKPIEKEVSEDNGPEKAELERGIEVSDSMVPSQNETTTVIVKDQGDSDCVTSSQQAPIVDVEETTTVIDLKEQDLNEKPREFIKEETEDKSLDHQEASKEYEEESKEEIEQSPKESVKKIEKEEESEEIKPGVEIEEKKEQNELVPAITTDVCISTQTKSPVEETEHEEEDAQNDEVLKEKPDIPSLKEVSEETGPEKAEYEKEIQHSEGATVNKDENGDEQKKQEVNVLEKDEGDDGVTSAQDVAFEKDLQEKNHHNEDGESEVVTTEESIEKENETVRKDEDQEKEQQIYVSEEGQSGGDDVTSLENASNKDIKETAIGQHDTTVAYVETGQGLSAMQREIVIEEAQDKPVDAQEETEQYDDGTKDERERKVEESVNETAHSYTKTEQEEYTEEIKTSVETIEEKDVCTSTQIESQEEDTKNEVKATDSEENNNEETKENDDGQTEKPESPLVEPVCEPTSLEIAESKEGMKQFDSFSTTLNENDTPSKEEKLEKEDEIESPEVQGGVDDVTSSQNASNEDIKEPKIGQHDTNVAYVEEKQAVSAMPKEILIEAEDKSIDSEEISLELGQPNEQNVEETHPCKAISENPEDEIKKEDKDLSHGSVEDIIKDNNTKEENRTIEQEPVEEHNGQDEVSKEKVADLNETTEVEPQEDITPSTSLTSTEDTSKSVKEKAESENLPLEDVETVSEVNIPELVPKSEESVLKEECFISETETHLDEEKEIVTKEISSEEKPEVQGGEDDVTSSQNASNEDIQETTIGQHVTTVAYVEEGQGVSSTPKEILIEEPEDKSIDVREMPLELGEPNEQNVEETHPYLSKTITQNPADEIKKENTDLSHESVEDIHDDTTKEEKCTLEQEAVEEHRGPDELSKEKVADLDETTEVEPQEAIIPSTSLTTSTEDTSNSEKEKAESENLPIEDLETVSDVQIPELVPKSEEPALKEESFVSQTETHLNEEKETITKEISSDEKTEQATEVKQETVKEVCEETSSEKTELEEGLKLSDSSDMKINEKEVTTFKDDDQEKDHEVNMSVESQGEDNITSSQNEDSTEKEDLQEKNYRNEAHEGNVLKSVEGVDEDTEGIKSSVETKENTEHVIATNVCSSTQTETNAETIENEEKNGETAIEYDENETVSREVNLEKKQEDVEETEIGEHATTVAYFEEEQSIGTVTKEVLIKEEGDKSVVAQEETEQYDDEKTDEREQKPEEHTDETKPAVETNEEKDICISTPIESQEQDTKKTESVEERQLSDSSNVKNIVDVAEDTEETQPSDETKENMEPQGLSHVIPTDVCSPTQMEYVEKPTEGEENNEVTINNDDGQTEKPESPLVEVACEVESSEIAESEAVKHSENFSTTLNENETLSKEEKLEKEHEIKTSEVQGAGDNFTSSQNASHDDIKETAIDEHDTTVAYVEEGQGVSAIPKEILIEEAKDKSIDAKEISSELGQPNEQNVEETQPSPTKITSENPEDEIKKEDKDLSHESVEETNDNIKEEISTAEQEPVEERSSQDEKEKVTDLNETTEVNPQEDITTTILLETSTKDTLNLEKEREETRDLPIEDLETVSNVQIPESVPKSEESVLKEECFVSETETNLNEEKGTITEEISSDEKTDQTTEIKQETVKEESEETRKEKDEFEEGLKLSDSTNMKINEKEVTTFKDDDQEKVHEVNIPAESQGEDHITSSHNEVSEEKEDLHEKDYQIEGNEGDLIKSGGVDEDTDAVKSSVETKENTEHVTTTNVCSSTQTEPKEETTESEEKNGENAIENDENETVSREVKLENIQEEVCSSAHTEPKEETIDNQETNKDVIESDDGQTSLENQEKEQELKKSELQGGDTSNEDIKETGIGQHATTTVHLEEGLGVNASTKEIITEEVEDKSVHAQEASEQNENEAKDKTEQQPEESINKPVSSCSETIEGSIKEEANAENKETESELEAESQADRTEDRSEVKDETVLTEKVTKELGQPKEQNAEEIQACVTETISETTEDKITKKDEDLSHDSIEHINETITKEVSKEIETSTLEHEPVESQNDNKDEVSKENFTHVDGTTAVVPREDVTPSRSLENSTEDTSNSDNAKAESENLPIKDLESVSEVHIPEVIPRSEGSEMKEGCLISATATHVNDENETEISSDENLETHGSTQQPEDCGETVKDVKEAVTQENATELEQTGEINSPYENRDVKEAVTQETQLTSTEDCGETVKDVILTEEIEQVPLEIEKEKELNDFKEQTVEEDSYSPKLEEKSVQNQKEIVHEISNSDSIPVENPEVTEKNVDVQIGQEDLQGKNDISSVSNATNDRVDQEPKEERIPSLEDAATVESQVNLPNIESTAYPSETEKLPTQALESDSDAQVQIPEVVADPELKAKEECVVLETAEHTDEKNVEEQDTKTDEISSAPDKEHENVTEVPTKSDEAQSRELIIEEKASTKENVEVDGELKPTSEPVIKDQVTIETKHQPEQSDITSENITIDNTSESKLEHTSEKDLEDGKQDLEEDVTLAPENEIRSVESQNEITKNIILTDEVSAETEKENERNEIEGEVSEEGNCPKELDNTSTPNQQELANEIEHSKPIPVDTEVTEVKAESQIVENIQAAEDHSCSSKASPVIETSKGEMHEDNVQTNTIIGEVKDDCIDEASKDKIIPVLKDSKASEPQVNLAEIESTDAPLNSQDNNERCINEEAQGNFGIETKDAKSENEAVEDIIINEVLPEDEKATESKSTKDIINEEAKLNQRISDTDEVSQIKSSSSRPDELLETKYLVEDTEEVKFMADSLNVKNETFTVTKGPSEDSGIVASEFKRSDTVTDKEKETPDEPQADDSTKTTYDSILSSTERDIELRSQESTDHGDTLKPEEKPTEDSEIVSEAAEIVPESREASVILSDNLPEASPSVDVVSKVECSETEPHLDTKEATSDFVNQENQREQKKEADESTELVIPIEDVKTSTREIEVGSLDLEVPAVTDATADKANSKTVEVHEAEKGLLIEGENFESTCDQSKPIEEASGVKQEPLEVSAPGALGTVATEDLKISQKYVTDDFIKISQTQPEIQKYEVPAFTVDKQSPNEPHPKESTESKILTEKTDSSHEQGEPIAKSLIPEAANLKANEASGTEPECSNTVTIDQKEKSESVEPARFKMADVLHEPAKGNTEVAGNIIGDRDSALTKDQQVEKQENDESGVKTDEEGEEEEEDHEDDEKLGSGSDAPVMVEASKDMEVKAPKKSHNILSGVGSKVKHSIAKVKKAITGKSSPPKSPSPKAKNQVVG